MPARPEELSLLELRRRFRELPAPALADVAGVYGGAFPRPGAYGLACRYGMAATGLAGWRGKRFAAAAPGAADAQVFNRVRGGREVKPLLARIDCSLHDARPALVCTYHPRETPPYRWIRDEFRRWDDRTLLALSFLDVPLLRRVGLPFVLRRVPAGERVCGHPQTTTEVAMEEHKPPEDDEAADVSAAGQAASATPDATLGDDPDPELVDAAEAAQRPDDEQ